ncbi:MAG: hypothetical protein ACI308_02065 [Muribaculaceae bacterium]
MNQNEHQHIATLLERFMNGESTLQEEEQLAQYFASHRVPREWEPYKQMFHYFSQGMPLNEAPALPRRRHPGVVILRWACAAAVVAIMAGVAWHLMTRRHSSLPQPQEPMVAAVEHDQPQEPLATTQSIELPIAVQSPQPRKATHRTRHHRRAHHDEVLRCSEKVQQNLNDCLAATEMDINAVDAAILLSEQEQAMLLMAIDAALNEAVGLPEQPQPDRYIVAVP